MPQAKCHKLIDHMLKTTNHQPTTCDKPLATHPLRVLMITGIFPPDIGGPATYVPTMASELVKRGHKITVITLSDSLQDDDHSYPFCVLRIRRGRFKPWRFLLTVATILRTGRHAQVLYVNGLYLESVVANFLLRKPLVEKIVGDWVWERATNKGWVEDNFEEFQQHRHDLKVELLKMLRQFCTRRADAVIVPSRYLGRAVTGWGVPESTTIVVYNAVELPLWSPIAVPLSTRFKVVTVGRLVSWKQIDHLIMAVAECDGAGLVIVGDGPERSRLEELVHNHHLGQRVFFAGQRDKNEALSLMAACDLFVLNSTYEGFPHVILEAMSVGLPIVATAVGGTPEVVQHGKTGVLVNSGETAALCATLKGLMDSSAGARQDLKERINVILERFSFPKMVAKTEEVLADVVRR
jgi:glycosyltransferase involved in cell wall biosynthesis